MKPYNATDDEFARFMVGSIDLLAAHGLAVRHVPIPESSRNAHVAAPLASILNSISPATPAAHSPGAERNPLPSGVALSNVATATSPADTGSLPAAGASSSTENEA